MFEIHKFRKAVRRADGMEPAGAVPVRSAAILALVAWRKAKGIAGIRGVEEMAPQFAAVAEADPSAAVELLEEAMQKAGRIRGQVVSEATLLEVLRRWFAGAEAARVAEGWTSWATIMHMGGGASAYPDSLLKGLADSGVVDTGEAVRRHVVPAMLDWIEEEGPTRAARAEALAAVGGGLSAADWICVAGDRAREGRRETLALRLYRTAAAQGSTAATERAEHVGARIARQRLVAGRALEATHVLPNLAREAADPEVLFLQAIAASLTGGWPADRVAAAIDRAAGAVPAGTAEFWRVVAPLAAADRNLGIRGLTVPATLLAPRLDAALAHFDEQDPIVSAGLADTMEQTAADIRGAAARDDVVTMGVAGLLVFDPPPSPKAREFAPLWSE